MKRVIKKGKLSWGLQGKVGKVGTGKIKNATSIEMDGIKFRSKLEAYFYKKQKEAGFNFEYENETYTIIEKFEFQGEKIRPITITPDFQDNQRRIIIEIKGFANESFPLRWKLFKRHLTINRLNFTVYLVKNKGDVDKLIEELKLK